EVSPAQLNSIPIDAIERIEIVRGSGAVLYGANATAGTINIITRRPKAGELHGRAIGRYGSFRTKEARVNGDAAGDVVGAGFAVSTEDTEGYRRNSAYKASSFSGRVEANGSAGRGFVKLGADRQTQRLPGSLTEQQIRDDPRQTTTPDDWTRREGGHVILGGARPFGAGHEVAADLGYRQKSTQSFFALFGGFYTDTDAEVWNFAPRAKLAIPGFGRRHELIVGGELEGWQYETRSASSPGTIGSPFSHRVGTQDAAAGYLQASI